MAKRTWFNRPDPRGPHKRWVTIQDGTSETLVTFECGHVGRFNQIFDYSLDAEHRCFDCGRLELAAYDAEQILTEAQRRINEDGKASGGSWEHVEGTKKLNSARDYLGIL